MEQLERMGRYLNRIRNIYAGINLDWGRRYECDDDVFSFFVHCYHVRDWMVHLNMVGLTAKQIDQFIDSKACLRICADLANGTKHCTLTRTIRSGGKPHIAGREYEPSSLISGGDKCQVVKAKYTILTATGLIDALELAEACVAAWQVLTDELKSHAAKLKNAQD